MAPVLGVEGSCGVAARPCIAVAVAAVVAVVVLVHAVSAAS